jgi:hypothetical protein
VLHGSGVHLPAPELFKLYFYQLSPHAEALFLGSEDLFVLCTLCSDVQMSGYQIQKEKESIRSSALLTCFYPENWNNTD